MINWISHKLHNIYVKSLDREEREKIKSQEFTTLKNSSGNNSVEYNSNITKVTSGNNIAIGYNSLGNITTGTNSTNIGRNSGPMGTIGISGTSGAIGIIGPSGKSGDIVIIGPSGKSYAEYISENIDKSIKYSEYGTGDYKSWKEKQNPKNKEIKRIYTTEDPYGEENWDE